MYAVNQFLGVINFSEHTVFESELRINGKLQETNEDRSEGDKQIQGNDIGLQRFILIGSHDRSSTLCD